MAYPRIIMAAPKSGSGKTFVTISLMKALSMRGKKVSAFKCGPDYIDPMFHKKILKLPSKNLDLFFSTEEQVRELFALENDGDISVIEGVMGLYDGLGGVSDQASTYHLAKALSAPIILVVNGKGMARSLLAEIKGFLSMDEAGLIKGVILNQVSAMLYPALKELLEEEFLKQKLSVQILGFVPEQKDLHLESRYLGLMLPDEIANLEGMAEVSAISLEKTVDIDALMAIAEAAENMEQNCEKNNINEGRNGESQESTKNKFAEGQVVRMAEECCQTKAARIRIAVARDQAFCFYYEDNLRVLREAGAELVEFSPIHDKKLPDNVRGLILGGGYPELWAKELVTNESMKKSILEALQKGMPLLAECGGFMYLHKEICTQDGTAYPMVGYLDASCQYKGKLVRFGYIELSEFGLDKPIKAHEFHYFDSTDNGEACLATKPVGGRSWRAGHKNENQLMGFPHLYYPSNPEIVEKFLGKCETYREI